MPRYLDAKLMKGRGYHAEDWLRKKISRASFGERVFRVPATIGRGTFPDLFSINNLKKRMFAFQVKSTAKDMALIPKRQISVMHKFLKAFALYPTRKAFCVVYFRSYFKWMIVEADVVQDYLIVYDPSKTIDPKEWIQGR